MTQPAPNYGVTMNMLVNGSGFVDIDPTGASVTGIAVLAQRLVLRQTTPLGSVIDSPNDCLDIQDMLSSGMTDAEIAQLPGQIQQELVKDQEVLAVVASVTYTPSNSTLSIVENIQSQQGPFSLTLTVTPSNVSFVIGQITGSGT